MNQELGDRDSVLVLGDSVVGRSAQLEYWFTWGATLSALALKGGERKEARRHALRPRKLCARATHRGANGSATLARGRFEWPTASR